MKCSGLYSAQSALTFSYTLTCLDSKEKRKTTQAVKITPHIDSGKGATLVPGTVKLLHQRKKENINGDQEGCRLDLKPSPDEN
jgi:hypothetical protein